MSDPSIVRFRKVVAAACDALEARRAEINDLNVFPVADGDTGDNMAGTLRAVRDELDRLHAGSDGTLDQIGRDEIVKAVARAALLGARGNSGVILSQIVRGLAEELASRPGELIDPALIAAALGRAVDAAYESVREPAEGTMLTVLREIAHRVSHDLAHLPRSSIDPGASAAQQDALLSEVLRGALAAGEESVRRGPELLPVLRESGVVDAGGYGLVVVLSGMLAALTGDLDVIGSLGHHSAPAARVHTPANSSGRYRFCTNYAVVGTGLETRRWIEPLEEFCDSVLVVGDTSTIRVHVHTDTPERALDLLRAAGAVVDVEISDMHEQTAARGDRLGRQRRAVTAAAAPIGRCGVVAVCSGPGVMALYQEFGATTIDGGETLNPSTSELLSALDAAPEPELVLLPNSANVLLAAERAAGLCDKTVSVVASESQQAGLSAIVAIDAALGALDNADALKSALAEIHTGAVTRAARDDGDGRFRKGDAVGFIDDRLVAWGEPGETLEAVLESLADGGELLTCLVGRDTPLSDDQVRRLAPRGPELELHDGGQPNWWWLIAAE